MDFSWCSQWDGKKYDIVFYGVSGFTRIATERSSPPQSRRHAGAYHPGPLPRPPGPAASRTPTQFGTAPPARA